MPRIKRPPVRKVVPRLPRQKVKKVNIPPLQSIYPTLSAPGWLPDLKNPPVVQKVAKPPSRTLGGFGAGIGDAFEKGISNLYNENRGVFGEGGQNLIEGFANKLKGEGDRIGRTLGNLVRYKKGGRIKNTGPLFAHKGEYILPTGVKPTKQQIKMVNKRKR